MAVESWFLCVTYCAKTLNLLFWILKGIIQNSYYYSYFKINKFRKVTWLPKIFQLIHTRAGAWTQVFLSWKPVINGLSWDLFLMKFFPVQFIGIDPSGRVVISLALQKVKEVKGQNDAIIWIRYSIWIQRIKYVEEISCPRDSEISAGEQNWIKRP